MSSYTITKYSYDRAKELGVEIKPSTNPKKKIDVFKGGKKIVSIGAYGFPDYPTYVKIEGKEYADKRRKLYLIRHKKNIGLAGKYAKNILW